MKKLSLLSTAAVIGLLTAPLQAGTSEVYKQVAAPPPVYAYGLGFYGAIDAGANVYQNRGDDFGAGLVRPTIEGDFFYNGFRGGADFTLRDRFGDTIGERNVTTWINSGAFMANFILRLAPGEGRFQPYAGAGVG